MGKDSGGGAPLLDSDPRLGRSWRLLVGIAGPRGDSTVIRKCLTCATLGVICRVGGTHCCAPPPSDSVRATRRGIRLKQAPLGGSGVEECWFLRRAGGPALAVRVDKAGAVRCACARFGGHVLLGDRFAGDPMPLLPLGGAGWLVVGVQEQPG